MEEPAGRTPHAPPRTFDDVYRDERRKLVRTAYLIVRSKHVAEELVHDGFVRLHQNFADVERPGGFLHTAVVHLCLTWLKRRDMEHDRLQRLDEPVDPQQEPDELWDAIGRLDPDRRVVVVLRYYEDRSYEQIAAAVGCPVGTVRSRLSRAIDDLREEIER